MGAGNIRAWKGVREDKESSGRARRELSVVTEG
jgi:hypothetical protein